MHRLSWVLSMLLLGVANGQSDDPSFLGCFSVDLPGDRTFEWVGSASNMTPEVCSELCPGWDFYGIQYSVECWCIASIEYIGWPCDNCDFYCMNIYENENENEDEDEDEDITLDHYRGCYSDPADNRIFVQAESSDDMTAESCASTCLGSAFYGTQYSNECWCGDINAPYSINGDGVCDMPCSGNSDESCGGYYSMDVYAIDPSYLGCFSDPADGRIFDLGDSSNDMASEVCATLCSDWAFYGTQYSQECWCGDNADYDANGFGVCDMPCSGNSTEICGGFFTMSVHQTI